jgi:RNA recognition motif-containing protein
VLLVFILRFGYADFPNSKLAQKAIKSLNETDLYGRNVRLDISNTKSNSTTPRGGRGGFGKLSWVRLHHPSLITQVMGVVHRVVGVVEEENAHLTTA